MVVRADMHDLGASAALLVKHIRDYANKGIQGFACENMTRPMAECLTATVTDSALLHR